MRLVVTLFLFSSAVVFSQESIKKHTVAKGETISSIAEKYNIKASEIIKLNPQSKNVLKLNATLIIPIADKNINSLSSAKVETSQKSTLHEVLAKETLYGISKNYGISVKELTLLNPSLANTGLQIGQKIIIPGSAITPNNSVIKVSSNTNDETAVNNTEKVDLGSVEVAPNDTKYAIAKRYGLTVKEFDNYNPSLATKSLKSGQKINLPSSLIEKSKQTNVANVYQPNDSNILSKEVKVENIKKEEIVSDSPSKLINNAIEIVTREVLPKETKYGIAKQYGLTVQELEKQNPAIKKGLSVGFVLSIESNVKAQNVENSDKENQFATIETKHYGTSVSDNNDSQNSDSETKSFANLEHNSEFLDLLIERASENIGTRYQTGGTSKTGFDCSGLMCSTFGAFDIKLPRTSIDQSSYGTKVIAEEAKKGDLIFFKTNGRNQINHVGMVVDVVDGEIKFIHASVGNGVIISSTKENYYKKKVAQVNRVL